MLGDDVHIDQSQGDWLGFDFDHESLNFTAEFVGPVTHDQVAEFHAAFDGTTPLRRATIAQFARIADAIEEDEVIGFGLYLNEGDDPGEWRCLSRRDALRITEEIEVLLGAGQAGQDSHLPVAADVNTNARYLFGRRDRGVEAARLTGAVREVEANLSRRISRLESDVADHSNHILDLRTKSVEAEQSMGRLLSAVEGFCEQAANRLETVTAPALSAAAAAGASQAPALAPALSEKLSKPEPSRESPKETNAKQDEARASSPSPLRVAQPVATAAPFQEQPSLDWWRSPMVITVGLGAVVILLGILFWPTSSNPGGASASEPVRSTPATVSAPPVAAPVVTENPAPAKSVAKPAAPAAPGATRIELVATEPTWVSIRGSDGATQMSGLIDPGKTQNVDVRPPAVLRAGNAGGLTIRTNGKSLGPLGPHGAVREVEFRNGEFKLVPIK
jgi:hypothetical protein